MKLQMISTLYEHGQIQKTSQTACFVPDTKGIEKDIVNIYPDAVFQTIHGFGGALTESAGYVLSKMPASEMTAILDAYYGENGLGYSCARSHIDSCDFSLGHYEALTDERGTSLESFSLERAERYVLPLIMAANSAAGGALPMMLTPWSPPAFMKTNGERNNGGFLLPEYYALWAAYICRTVLAYRARGINVCMLSVQNEPKAVQIWDSCIFTADAEKVFIRDYLAPALKAAGLHDMELLIWDHNKERAYDRAKEVISDDEMAALVSGVAVHWYSGDHFEALDLIKRRFPDKRLVFSEACVEYLVVKEQNALSNAKMYAHEIIGALNHGLDTFMDWNIALDLSGGPNHAGNYCAAPIMCDIEKGTWQKQLSFEYIGHFSRHIKPGAKRIGFSRFSSLLECTAAQNPDGSLVAVIMNTDKFDREIFLRLYDTICPLTVKGDSLNTIIIG